MSKIYQTLEKRFQLYSMSESRGSADVIVTAIDNVRSEIKRELISLE